MEKFYSSKALYIENGWRGMHLQHPPSLDPYGQTQRLASVVLKSRLQTTLQLAVLCTIFPVGLRVC